MGWEGLSDNHVACGAQRQQADNKAGGDEPPNPTPSYSPGTTFLALLHDRSLIIMSFQHGRGDLTLFCLVHYPPWRLPN